MGPLLSDRRSTFFKMANVDDPALQEAYADVRSDASETNWAVLTYADNNTIKLEATGSGDVSDIRQYCEPNCCLYAYVRIVTGDEESKRAKFVFISWTGESAPIMRKAKMSVHKASVNSRLRFTPATTTISMLSEYEPKSSRLEARTT